MNYSGLGSDIHDDGNLAQADGLPVIPPKRSRVDEELIAGDPPVQPEGLNNGNGDISPATPASGEQDNQER